MSRGCGSQSQPEHCFHPRQLHTVDGFTVRYDWCCQCHRTPEQIESEGDTDG